MEDILKSLREGNLQILRDVSLGVYVSNIAAELINNPVWNQEQIEIADIILRVSNIAYNNTSADVLFLDDGIYDQLLVLYQKYNPNYQVGAEVTPMVEQAQNEIIDSKVMCNYVSNNEMDSHLFVRDIWGQHTPIAAARPRVVYADDKPPITKRLINTTHKYPELVGTLDKCKFVTISDAAQEGVADKPSIKIFERDFIHKCLDKGVIHPNERFEMVGELKYDGVSVEAEVQGDTIIAALSRGDTAENIATDLTPILGGYKFPNAGSVPNDFKFGIKFEAVITKRNLELLGELRGKSYKNARNGIIGLFSASDAYRYVDFITLIPLSCSLELPRADELKFLNAYYNSGEVNRHVFFQGNYQEIIFQVREFTEAAETIRKILPYMIDGVVISFTDPNKISALGRENSVNKYSMAIKFNPRVARTTFVGYTYSIGKSGEVIPMVHFKPCEFIGGIHTKQTIHSYERFKELNLAIGEQIDVKYVNDVISYVTKPDTEFNRNFNGTPEKFIEICPFCGTKIAISPSGKSARCVNLRCPERMTMRMVDMVDRLGFRDVGEQTVRDLKLTSLTQLLDPYSIDLSPLGDVERNKFMSYCLNLRNAPIEDYKLMSALSFDGMAEEKWKSVFSVIPLRQLTAMDDSAIKVAAINISGIGKGAIESIIAGIRCYRDEIDAALRYMTITDFKNQVAKPKVAFTGFRDAEFTALLNANGYDANDKYTVTKNTFALIALDPNENSGKITTARKYGIPIYTREEFLKRNNIVIQ